MSAPILRPASLAVILAAAALVSACNIKAHDENGNESASISFGSSGDDNDSADNDDNDSADSGDNVSKAVTVNVPGFSAKLAIPDLDLGGKDTDIDGIELYPGTKMNGVNVTADGSSGNSDGKVVMAFSAPVPPDQLIGYYKGEAAKAGWKEEPAPAGSQFAASKTDDKGKISHLTLNLAAAGTGSTGKFNILGG